MKNNIKKIDSVFAAVDAFTLGTGYFGSEYEERCQHIADRHFLNKEGLKVRMRTDQLRVGSAFTEEVSLTDVEEYFLDEDIIEAVAQDADLSDKSSGVVVCQTEWYNNEVCGFSLEYQAGKHTMTVCRKVAVVVFWEEYYSAKTKSTELACKVKTAFPVNEKVSYFIKYNLDEVLKKW